MTRPGYFGLQPMKMSFVGFMDIHIGVGKALDKIITVVSSMSIFTLSYFILASPQKLLRHIHDMLADLPQSKPFVKSVKTRLLNTLNGFSGGTGALQTTPCWKMRNCAKENYRANPEAIAAFLGFCHSVCFRDRHGFLFNFFCGQNCHYYKNRIKQNAGNAYPEGRFKILR